jgi:hypothetical protein
MEKQSTMIWGGCWAGLFAAFWALVFNGTLIVYVLNIPHHWPIILLVLLGVLVETLLLGLFGMLTTIYLAFAAIDTIFRDKKQPKKRRF